MSRCFPYPPPGFNKATDEALIDLIKLQKVEKANKERKEKRKEKKEKRKEKKEKKGLKKENKETVDAKLTDLHHESCKYDNKFDEEYSHKRKHEEIEQLEGSSVTEEHGQPLNLQNPSYSSDSTQDCNMKRKKVSFANDSCGHGNIIRIKLPLQNSGSEAIKKQLSYKEPDVLASKEQCCSTSERSEIHKQNCFGSGLTSLDGSGQDVRTSQAGLYVTSFKTDNALHGLSPCPSNEMRCPTTANAEVLAQACRQIMHVSVPSPCSTSLDKKMLKRNSQYTDLIQNLYQMALPHELDDNDQEWLFGGKHLDTPLNKTIVGKQFAVSSDVACSGSSMQLPCACYLQEAQMFALPYTVPF